MELAPTGRVAIRVVLIVVLATRVTGAPTLPPIWDETGLEDEAESWGTFRVLSEIHLDDRSSYQVEEWLDGPHRRFRLDVLPLQADPQWTGNETSAPPSIAYRKKTFLIEGAAAEHFFFYEPFKCYNLNKLDPEGPSTTEKFIEKVAKLGPLFERFPPDGVKSRDSLLIGGLASIWLAALSSRAPVRFKRAKAHTAIVAGRRRGKTKTEVMSSFDKFTVESSDSFQYRTEFYFLDQPATDSSEQLTKYEAKDLIAVHLIDPNYLKTKMSCRIISLDVGVGAFPPRSIPSGSSATGHLRGNLFELPLGYGCDRGRASTGRRLDYKPPRNCFKSDQPHTCYLEASIWVPPSLEGGHESDQDEVDEPADLDRWRQHVSNMRIITGRIQGRAYLSLEATDFAPVAPVQAELNLDTLEVDGQAERWEARERNITPGAVAMRRAKRIWDLGERVATASTTKGDDGSNQSDGAAAHKQWKPIHFGLADHLRSCAAVGQAELDELPSIDFQLLDFDETRMGARHKRKPTSRALGLSLIDDEMLANFFERLDGFKLVREDPETWRRFQSVHQEKRVERFVFRDISGKPSWMGPVSVIRKFHFMDALGEHLDSIQSEPIGGMPDSNQPEVPVDALRVELTLILLSPMLDRQLARIRLVMSPGLLVDEAHFHRELDIGPCLSAAADESSCRPSWQSQPSSSWPYLTGSGSDGHRDLSLVYLLDEPLPGAQLDSARSQIYVEFLRSLTSESLLGSHGSKLNLLQVNQVQVDIEPELVRISCRINKWPHTYDYVRHSSARPTSGSNVRRLLSELKPSAELCARTCSHYQCPVFVFGLTSSHCEIYVFSAHSSESSARRRPIEFQSDLTSDAYERRQGAERPYAEPRYVLARMRELMLEREGDNDVTNALAIRLELDAGLKVNLVLDSLEASDERWHLDKLMLEADRLEALAANTSGGPSPEVLIDQGDSSVEETGGSEWRLEVEFVYLLTGHRFAPDDQLGHSGDFPVAEAKELSRAECELLCLENDCRSYSYCDLDRSCIVSKLMEEGKIKSRSERMDFCKLMVVDHLSKFQPTALGVTSSSTLVRTINSEGKTDDTKAWLRLRFDSLRDCAMACLATPEFVCRSFFFCRLHAVSQVSRAGTEEGDCYLFASRHSGAPFTVNLNNRRSEQLREEHEADDTCDYYQRSYLVEYHEFHGRRLAAKTPGDGEQRQIEIRLGVGAEECAAECSQVAQGDRVCRAFEVCLGGVGGKSLKSKRLLLTCGLLLENSRAGGNSADGGRAASLLADGSKCTAFVRLRTSSTGSTPSLEDAQSSGGGGEGLELETLSPDGSQAASAGGVGGSWTSVAVVLLSLVSGYSTSWLVVALVRRLRQQVNAAVN